MRPSSQRSLKTSTLTTCRVNKKHMQTRWHPSPLHWPFQLDPRRKYSSTVATCTAANLPLKTIRLQEETFKSKRFSRFWQASSLGIGNSLSLTLSYMTYCLTTPRRQLYQKESSSILLQCDHADIISPIVWWNPAPMPFTQRGTGSMISLLWLVSNIT